MRNVGIVDGRVAQQLLDRDPEVIDLDFHFFCECASAEARSFTYIWQITLKQRGESLVDVTNIRLVRPDKWQQVRFRGVFQKVQT